MKEKRFPIRTALEKGPESVIKEYAPRYEVSVDEATKEQANALVFDALNAETASEQENVMERVIELLSVYDYKERRLGTRGAKPRDYYKEICDLADKLLDKVNESPADFGQHALGDTGDVAGDATDFAKMLEEIRDRARVFAEVGSQKKQPDVRLFCLIVKLGELYRATTGNKPGRSTGSYDSKPGGPFFRLVSGTYLLGKIHKSDEAIAQDIRRARNAPIAQNMDK